MKIKSIKSWKENLELTRPYTIAFKTIKSVENCFVAIELENGIVGLGAGNPSFQVVGESIEDTENTLAIANIEWLENRKITDFYALCREVQIVCKNRPGAAAALDIALHDAFTQYLNVPLAGFLGQKFNSLPTSITIGIKSIEESLEEAKEYFNRGFRYLKIKLGKSLDQDLELLEKLREAYKTSIHLRIDANQGYNKDQLIKFFHQTRDLNLELIEQPLPAKNVQELKSLPKEVKKVIAADESLISPKDALNLNNGEKACDIFNIKLMKCGGINQARIIAQIADITNTELMWGCNDESIISITAALHTAFSSNKTKYLDLDGSLDLAKDIVEGGFIINKGNMSINEQPGLGLKRI